MKIQSLSVCVPGGCPNNCRYCVAHIHRDNYPNMLDEKLPFLPFYDLYFNDYLKRLEFARDNGCNIAMLTGDGEPLANRSFLKLFGLMNQSLESPFRWIELQTSGVYLNDQYLRFLRNHVGVTTISLSLSSLNTSSNANYNQIPRPLVFDIEHLCNEIKRYDFNLRLSLNLTDVFEEKYGRNNLGGYTLDDLFVTIKNLGADQVTFRVLYTSQEKNTPQDKWIEEHRAHESFVEEIRLYIKENGRPLVILPFGATKYALHGMSTVLDDDCMSTEVKDTLKYLILRPDCKLYSHWDLKDSLVF
jgi:sulfatase maturation enzyme AslB (radical SAM superfamily)